MRLRDLTESNTKPIHTKTPALAPEIRSTISPTMTIPDLVNSDTYRQYRYSLALASAEAVKAGEVVFDAESTWNESLAAIAYTPQELEIFKLANKMMGVDGVMISDSPSQEPENTQKVSPVMKFNMFESESDQMRDTIEKIK